MATQPGYLNLFDALYTLASQDGREAALFGDCFPLAREAFECSLIGDEFPLLWFEVPLSGNPRFDLHVALSREALRSGVHFLPGAGNGYDDLFSWYAEDESGGGGLAFAYDVSEGTIDQPAVHVNVNNAPLSNMDRFFDLAAGDGAADLYAAFAEGLPHGWIVWYAGVHPGRPHSPIRVDCFVDYDLQKKYASDTSLLVRDLRACGFSASCDALPELAATILKSPFALELQFDVLRDGSLGPTLGLSAGFKMESAQNMRPLFEEGAGAALLSEIQSLGLADDRWKELPRTMFSKLLNLDNAMCAIYCLPTFVKLRMREGKALDAKLYLQSTASII